MELSLVCAIGGLGLSVHAGVLEVWDSSDRRVIVNMYRLFQRIRKDRPNTDNGLDIYLAFTTRRGQFMRRRESHDSQNQSIQGLGSDCAGEMLAAPYSPEETLQSDLSFVVARLARDVIDFAGVRTTDFF